MGEAVHHENQRSNASVSAFELLQQAPLGNHVKAKIIEIKKKKTKKKEGAVGLNSSAVLPVASDNFDVSGHLNNGTLAPEMIGIARLPSKKGECGRGSGAAFENDVCSDVFEAYVTRFTGTGAATKTSTITKEQFEVDQDDWGQD